ncbi:hypothetical protein AB0P21_37670 [Kribbella sp. NPDC056861]|uniref:hypothetical protein n=1 Tax=Kribbella sp. NPDC056861 TaxID=3154857 RepID=UPI003437BB91
MPGVVGLHGGVFGEVATYLPGRRVAGIRITPERAEVHLTLVWGEPVRATAEIVRDVVGELTGVPVFVTVEDVVRTTSLETSLETSSKTSVAGALDGAGATSTAPSIGGSTAGSITAKEIS